MSQEVQAQTHFEQTFIHLTHRAIQAKKPADLYFTITNETMQLVEYRQAAFFSLNANKKPYLINASGLVDVSENSPYSVWINRLARHFKSDEIYHLLTSADLNSDLLEGWSEWLPEHVLILPLKNAQSKLMGYSLFAKEQTWDEKEISLLANLHQYYAYSLEALNGRRKNWLGRFSSLFKLKFWLLAAAVFAGLMLIPVRLTALAPAEVIALNALSVAAPQEGVIHTFMVEPNAIVKKGDVLFTLDDTAIGSRLEIANKALAIAKADALVAEQRAFDELKGKAELASSLGKVREKEAELEAVRVQAERIEVVAEQDGVAVFSDTNDWIGRPVQTGERVLQIADPKQAGLLVWLPVHDALNLEKGAQIKMFLHTKPLEPIDAKLKETSYQASLSPENVASYRLKGSFTKQESLPRIGLHGTARISGEWSILGYYLFRRPIAALRERTGW